MPCLKNGMKSIGWILLSAFMLVGCSGGGASSSSASGTPLPSGEVVSVEIPTGGDPSTPPSTEGLPPSAETPPPSNPTPADPPASTPPLIVDGWMLKHKETFDTPLPANLPWERDAYGQPEDPWDEDGLFFFKKYESFGKNFADALGKFISFRKSFPYSENGWLTFELYGRDANRDGALDPESEHGGEFLIAEMLDGNRVLQLNDQVHYDGAEVRSTEPLPSEYRIRLNVTPVSAGGRDEDGVWRKNGYSDATETADPWRFTNQSATPMEAWRENGFYFLTILDTRPMPHNNVWIHHHRKVVIDSDNNIYPDGSWSTIWTPRGRISEGSHPVSMLALDGNNFGSVWTGNPFHCFYNGAFRADCGPTGHTAADAYINGETYTVTIERTATHYILEVSGRFQYGGQTTYRGAIDFRRTPVWHYNNTPEDAPRDKDSQPMKNMGIDWSAWPADSAYPDYFMFGDPHITHYEGTVLYDDVELWVRP